MKLIIFGATGHVGSHLVEQSLKQGHEVSVFARSTSVPAEWRGRKGLRVIEGSVLDAEAVAQAVQGQDAVLSSLGLKRINPSNPWSKLASPADFASRSGGLIAEAMQKHGVKRFVCVSAAGVAETYPKLNLIMKVFLATSTIGLAYKDLEKLENYLKKTDLDWTACRPTRLTDDALTKQVHVIEDGTFSMNAAISRADVAYWMLEALSKAPAQRTPTISHS